MHVIFIKIHDRATKNLMKFVHTHNDASKRDAREHMYVLHIHNTDTDTEHESFFCAVVIVVVVVFQRLNAIPSSKHAFQQGKIVR